MYIVIRIIKIIQFNLFDEYVSLNQKKIWLFNIEVKFIYINLFVINIENSILNS